MGSRGENTVDDTVWIVKSHSPWLMPEAPLFKANKVLVIVRSPLDTNLSWFNLIAMASHDTKVPFEIEKDYPNFFDWWIKDCNKHINDWMQQMMKDAKFYDVPMLFIRFEDLVNNPEPELYNLMRFILGKKDLTGTNAERRIKEIIAMDKRVTETYKLKDSTRRKNPNAYRYTQEQLDWIGQCNKDWLHFFGYAKLPSDPENETGFFEFDDADEEMNRQYYGYRR